MHGNVGKPKRKCHDAFEGDPALVVQYKPLILSETRKYSRRYWLKFKIVIGEAVRLAEIAERKFDPQRGHKFGNYLLHNLKGLNRFCKRQYRLLYRKTPSRSQLEAWELEKIKRERKQESEHNRGGWRTVGNYAEWKAELGPDELAQAVGTAEGLRYDLKLNKKKRAMLDWLIGASDIDITKGYASKIICNLVSCNLIKLW